nr:MAG TPA: hypothetical protein [Caudoviricetes sp.]
MIKLLGITTKNNTIKEYEKARELTEQINLILNAHRKVMGE